MLQHLQDTLEFFITELLFDSPRLDELCHHPQHPHRLFGMHGFYRAISENLPEIKGKILFVTGNSTNEVISFFKEHGCKYIAKPNLFDESGLLDQIKCILDK